MRQALDLKAEWRNQVDSKTLTHWRRRQKRRCKGTGHWTDEKPTTDIRVNPDLMKRAATVMVERIVLSERP